MMTNLDRQYKVVENEKTVFVGTLSEISKFLGCTISTLYGLRTRNSKYHDTYSILREGEITGYQEIKRRLLLYGNTTSSKDYSKEFEHDGIKTLFTKIKDEDGYHYLVERKL